jgi:hypothetical protein
MVLIGFAFLCLVILTLQLSDWTTCTAIASFSGRPVVVPQPELPHSCQMSFQRTRNRLRLWS